MKRSSMAGEDPVSTACRLGVLVVVVLLTPTRSFAAPGDVIASFLNDWAFSTIGLAHDPASGVVRYAHESQSSGHRPTIYDYDPVAGTIVHSMALSTQNADWPWQIDNVNGATYDPDTETWFLPDYNGDLSYADDNIVEVDAVGNIIGAWEMDDELGSNDCANGGAIDDIIDIARDPYNSRRYYVTAAYDGNTIYYVELTSSPAWWTPNSWVLLETIVPADLDGIIEEILAIEWDDVHRGFWVTDWHSDNIALLDRTFNPVQILGVTTPSGFSSGITPMNSVPEEEPYQLWLTDFSSDTTTIVESLSTRPIANPQADVSVTKDDGSSIWVPNSTTTYRVVVANAGPQPAEVVRLVDTSPADASIRDWTCTAAGGAICPNPSGYAMIDETTAFLPVGATLTYLVDVGVSALKDPTTTLENTASVYLGTDDPDLTNNQAVDINASPISFGSGIVTFSDGSPVYTPGTTVVYNLVVANFTPLPAPGANVRIMNPVPTGTTTTWECVAGGTVSCPSATGSGVIDTTVFMSYGDLLSFSIAVDVPADHTGDLENTVTIASTLSFSPGSQVTDTNTQLSEADLSVSKTNGQLTYRPGTESTYVVTVVNDGPSDATEVRIQDTAPSGTSFTGWTCTATGGAACPFAAGAGDLDETLATLPTGGSVVYELTLAIPSTYGEGGGLGSSLVNSARVSGFEHDPDIADNTATDSDERLWSEIFSDGFESGDLLRWSTGG